MLYHKDLEMYLYPGGHIDREDSSIYETALREVKEESGIRDMEVVKIKEKVIPFDIDIHTTKEVKAKQLPSHKHYDFRYLFVINKEEDVEIDKSEHNDYKWVDIQTLAKEGKYKRVVEKLRSLLDLNE